MKEEKGYPFSLDSNVLEGAYGHLMCPYLIALEGWRRGLSLKWYSKESGHFANMKVWYVDEPGRLFSLSSEDRTHYFFRSRGDKVTNQGVELASNKELTKEELGKAHVPIPRGETFNSRNNLNEIITKCQDIGFPLVVKPVDGSFGKGVKTNITNEKQLEEAVIFVRDEMNYNEIIVERYIEGADLRLYVVGDEVVGAIQRKPAHVIGDGVNSIKDLIYNKNESRKQHPRLRSCLIKEDDELKHFLNERGYYLESIPKEGEVVVLRETANISLGGDSLDVLDIIPSQIKEIAINAIKAVPGLLHGGVDLICDMENVDNTVVIELNPTSQIGSLVFPLEGKSRDIPEAIIDFYFPETKNKKKSNFFFNYKKVLLPLSTGVSSEVEVADAPLGDVYALKYKVYGRVNNVSYHQWLRKTAFELGLDGYVDNISNESIDIIVAGTNKESVEGFQNHLYQSNHDIEIFKIDPIPWSKPICIGFDIHAELKEIKYEIKKVNKKIEKIEKQREKAEAKYLALYQSRLWKLTRPIRFTIDLLKRIKKIFS
ncbi:acylphosphatase [Halalkalibacter sp. APA_J-10(15)]|uniref:acylphosphatase n=1 Tax=Halalkalibacter sp. APA_J-10(15) TaxID=2933805 RepID=UPI001FF4D3E2|nr:acylphosphatase [Halalkalibacter sp. APA_J-10(15)]MCK0470259.1 acylphosphatase [Halalkalibacter sp. APA_J-10(15)]